MNGSTLRFANLKVGLTIFLGLLSFFILLFYVGTEANLFSSKYELKIFLSNIEGLKTGSMVSLGGLKVGSVEKMEFVKKDGVNGILVTFNVLEKYQYQITKNSRAIIKTVGLLGDQFIDITLGQEGEPPLAEGEFLTVKPTLTFDKFADKIEPIVEDFSGVIKNIKTITDSIAIGDGTIAKLLKRPDAGNNLEKVLKNLSSFTSALANKKGALGKFAYESEIYDQISTLASNLNSVTDSLKQGKGTLGKLFNDDKLYNNIHSISARLDKLLSKTESDSTMIGGLINDSKFYREFNSLLIDLNKLIVDLKEHPEDYIQFSVF